MYRDLFIDLKPGDRILITYSEPISEPQVHLCRTGSETTHTIKFVFEPNYHKVAPSETRKTLALKQLVAIVAGWNAALALANRQLGDPIVRNSAHNQRLQGIESAVQRGHLSDVSLKFDTEVATWKTITLTCHPLLPREENRASLKD